MTFLPKSSALVYFSEFFSSCPEFLVIIIGREREDIVDVLYLGTYQEPKIMALKLNIILFANNQITKYNNNMENLGNTKL